MQNITLTKTLTKKGDKTYVNFYLNLGGDTFIAIKPSFQNDFHILNKLAKLYLKEKKEDLDNE